MKLSSATFVNPPSNFLIDDMIMPPLGIMGLSSLLIEHGYNSHVLDLAGSPDRLLAELNGTDDEYQSSSHYFITATTPQYEDALKCLHIIKSYIPDAVVVIGGAHAKFRSIECIGDGFDYAVSGEGENACLSLMDNNLSDISIETGVIVDDDKQITSLDCLPYPDRTFREFIEYHYEIDGIPYTTMFTSRGCPFHCSFCSKMFNGIRLRSASHVLSEVDVLKHQYGFKGIMFFDDTFTFDKQRLRDICDGMRFRGMKWRCFIHANTVDYETLIMMKNCGCVEVGMGVESGNSDILKKMNKHISLDMVRNVITMCSDAGLRIKTFFIAGLPGETYKSMTDTETFLRETKPDDFDLTLFTPFPGNDIWNNTENYDIVFDKQCKRYSDMFYKGRDGEYKPLVSTSSLTSEEIANERDAIVMRLKGAK